MVNLPAHGLIRTDWLVAITTDDQHEHNGSLGMGMLIGKNYMIG